jgi:methionyl-tRNA formyltransferase
VIGRKVRAYQPWPSAYTTWNGQQMKVLRARAGEGVAAPGEVIAGGRNEAGVGTGAGVWWLEEVQLAGKKATPITAFLAGARGFVGSKLG